jgi:carbonic anhydrase/acetyltransferase-like protein (isoleucine patch superfamily)
MPIYALGDLVPKIHPDAYVHPDAVVIGQVSIDYAASVWPLAVLRGDFGRIVIGAETSIQDGTIVHADPQHATIVGSRCVVGHNAHLEGCTIGDNCLVGSMSTVLNGACVEPCSLVAAGALVPPWMIVPSGTRAVGVPAAIVPDEIDLKALKHGVNEYLRNAQRYAGSLRRVDI